MQLYMKQKVFSWKDKFSIQNSVGEDKYFVEGKAISLGKKLRIYDMTGNVFEWCDDYYEPYSSEKQVNPQGPSKGANHVLRGGDFRIDNLNDMKVSTRYFDAPFVNRKGAGLRLVINIK